MLVNIPANRKRVVAVSFPRDLAITPMSCEAWDPETGDYGPVYDKHTGEWSDQWRYTETKLNSAYSLGGPKCLVKAIQKISGLSINRFMAVDFNGFAKMVDALGGSTSAAPPRWRTTNSGRCWPPPAISGWTATVRSTTCAPGRSPPRATATTAASSASSCSCPRCCAR